MFVFIVVENNYEEKLLEFDYTVNEVEGVYKAGFENLILLKDVTTSIIEFEIEKNKTYTYINENPSEYQIFNGKKFSYDNKGEISDEKNNNIVNPAKLNLLDFKLGNSLISVLNENSFDEKLREELNILYNGDSCQILFNNNNGSELLQYDFCSKFWSSILLKGMEQSITQMIIEKNSVIDELNSLYRGDKDITQIMFKESSFRNFEFFLQFYFLQAFWKTSELFDDIKLLYIKDISNTYLVIMIAYMIVTFILVFVIRAVIASSRKVFNSFLNFIVILPAKFLSDDPYFLEEVLKLEEKLY